MESGNFLGPHLSKAHSPNPELQKYLSCTLTTLTLITGNFGMDNPNCMNLKANFMFGFGNYICLGVKTKQNRENPTNPNQSGLAIELSLFSSKPSLPLRLNHRDGLT